MKNGLDAADLSWRKMDIQLMSSFSVILKYNMEYVTYNGEASNRPGENSLGAIYLGANYRNGERKNQESSCFSFPSIITSTGLDFGSKTKDQDTRLERFTVVQNFPEGTEFTPMFLQKAIFFLVGEKTLHLHQKSLILFLNFLELWTTRPVSTVWPR